MGDLKALTLTTAPMMTMFELNFESQKMKPVENMVVVASTVARSRLIRCRRDRSRKGAPGSGGGRGRRLATSLTSLASMATTTSKSECSLQRWPSSPRVSFLSCTSKRPFDTSHN